MITIMISTVSTIGTYPMLDTNTMGYRTKRVGFIGDGTSKLLAPSLF